MDTNCRKRLRLLGLVVLHGSGSRNAVEAVMWFSETAHIALGDGQPWTDTHCVSREGKKSTGHTL